MGGINGMAKYQHHFGLSSAGVGTLIVFGLYTVNLLYPDRRFNKLCVYSGSVCGTTPAAYLQDRFGRRFSILFFPAMHLWLLSVLPHSNIYEQPSLGIIIIATT